MNIFLLSIILAFFNCACGLLQKNEQSNSAPESPELTKPSDAIKTATALHLVVAYEPGAEPFITGRKSTTKVWSLTEVNLKSLLGSKITDFTIPKELNQMQALPAQGKQTWTINDIFALAEQVTIGDPKLERLDFKILFLNGYLDGDTTQTTLGAQFGEYNVVAIFKDVVTATDPLPAIQRFVEQTTVIHEFGHALGLVNNGIAPVADHEDEEHQKHCKEATCIMYWLNEDRKNLREFIIKYVTTESALLFDSQCQEDLKAHLQP